MNKPLLFLFSQMTALGDLVASLNRNGIGYDLTMDEQGVEIRIHKGY